MEIIKTAIKVGNSAGVLLPKKWLNSQVKIVLEPLNIGKAVLGILVEKDILKNILGIYLVGSYAREEQTIDSDVDILAITDNVNKKIKKEKYEIICISKEELKNQLNRNALPILPMMKEAKPLLNSSLLEEYKYTKLTKKNLKWHIETTKSAMGFVEKDIEISKGMGEENTSDQIAYSLILRLRTLYIIDYIRKNKMWKKKSFLKLVKDISGSSKAYESYLRSKNNKKVRNELPIKEAEKLMNHINKKVGEVEKWLKGKKG